ncbi:MAG: T9SS type A sorting domain-containing protein [Bacteroidota bacterium]
MKNFFVILFLAGTLYSVNIDAQLKITPPKLFAESNNIKKPQLPLASDKLQVVSPALMRLSIKKAVINLADQLAAVKGLCPFLQPRVLLTLEAHRKNEEKVLLEWKAKNAFEAQEYILERSVGDTQHFVAIDYISPAENSKIKEAYESIDDNGYVQQCFYKVKLSLKSGDIMYSNIATITGIRKQLLSVYPNPATNLITVVVRFNEQPISAITILDANGRAVAKQFLTATGKAYSHQLDVSRFASGNYFIKLELGDKTSEVQMFIRQ